MTCAQPPLLFSGTSHLQLANEIATYLKLELSQVRIDTFPDNEIFVQVLDHVRGRDCFIIQSISRRPNHYLMELLILIDALKRASAKSIIAVMPYYGYARQDRRQGRVSIAAKLVADMVQTAGATRVVTMDLHAEQIQGFFNIPVDNLFARPQFVKNLQGMSQENCVVVTPDIGSIRVARALSAALNLPFAIVDKRRLSAQEVEATTVIGTIAGKRVIVVDDMISTAGTLVAAAQACVKAGAKHVHAVATHALLVGEALLRIEASPIETLFVSNTVPGVDEMAKKHPKIRVVSVAALFGEAISRIVSAQSISTLF
jgi:ribose-phosphate pyrophosphokinase